MNCLHCGKTGAGITKQGFWSRDKLYFCSLDCLEKQTVEDRQQAEIERAKMYADAQSALDSDRETDYAEAQQTYKDSQNFDI